MLINVSVVYKAGASNVCMLRCVQVLRKRLSLVQPTVRTDGGFEYEEGEGLDEDEVRPSARIWTS